MNMSKKEKKQFIGPRQIKEIVKDDSFKTYGGNDVFKVVFEGDYEELMTQKDLDVLKTEEPLDFTALNKRKIGAITKEVLEVLAEWNLKGDDVESLTNSIANEMFNSFNKATHYLWTGSLNSFTPGSNSVLERSLLEAHKIITKIDESEKEKNND